MIKLRSYQQDAIDEALKAYTDRSSFLVCVPTGGGKTVICREILKSIGGNALFLAHTSILVQQASLTLEGLAVCRTMQSEVIRKRRTPFDVLVVDEAHHSVSRSYSKIIGYYKELNPSLFLLGLTATPQRGGIEEVFGRRYTIDIKQLIAEGYLCPVRAIALTGVRVWDDVPSVQVKNGALTSREFSQKKLSICLNTPSHNLFVLEKYREYASHLKTIVFCVDIKHAETLCSLFNKNGIRSEIMCGFVGEAEKESIFSLFREGEIKVLFSCIMLTEGYDEPAVSCGINLHPTKSSIRFEQMLGRILRTHPSKKESLFLDFVYSGQGLGSAFTSCNLSWLPTSRVRVSADANGVRETYRTKSKLFNPFETYNQEYNIFECKADNPYFICIADNVSVIWCFARRTGIKEWASRFIKVSKEGDTYYAKALEYHIKGRVCRTIYFGGSDQLKPLLRKAIAVSGFTIKATLGWVNQKENRRTDKALLLLLAKFRIKPTHNALEDETALIELKCRIALKHKDFYEEEED